MAESMYHKSLCDCVWLCMTWQCWSAVLIRCGMWGLFLVELISRLQLSSTSTCGVARDAQCCPCLVSYNVPLTHSVTAAERPPGVEGDETKYAVPDLHTPTPLLLPPYWGQAGFFDTFKINLDVFKFPALFKQWNLKCWNKKSHFLDEICKTKCFNFGWWPLTGS